MSVIEVYIVQRASFTKLEWEDVEYHWCEQHARGCVSRMISEGALRGSLRILYRRLEEKQILPGVGDA
jgi:hypothetical protein